MRLLFGARGGKRSPLRLALMAALAIFLLLLAIAGYLIATFDVNAHKARLANIVREKTGRELSLPGALRLKLLPQIRLELDKAILHERGSQQAFASIESVKLSLRPWPLLHKEIIIDQAEIGSFNLQLKRYANGTTNFDDLLSKDDVPSSVQFDLAGLTIKNGALTFVDEMMKRTIALTQLRLTAGRLKENIPTALAANFLLAIDNPQTQLQTALAGELTFDLQRKRYQFKQGKITLQGEAGGIKPLDVGLQASIDADLQAGRFDLKQLQGSATGRNDERLLTVQLATTSVHAVANGQQTTRQVNLEQLSASIKAQETGRNLTLDITLPQLNRVGLKTNAANLKLKFGLQQDALSSNGEINAALNVDQESGRVSLSNLAATSQTVRDKLQIDASAAGPMTLNLKSGELDALQLSGDWKMKNPDGALTGKWRAPLTANITNGALALDALQGDWSGEFVGAKMNGNLRVPVSGNFRNGGGNIPEITLQTSVVWPDSALEANIHADLQAISEQGEIAAKSVALKASGQNQKGKWRATLSSPVKMDLQNQRVTMAKLIGDVAWTDKNPGAKAVNLKLTGNGNADLAKQQAAITLQAKLDQSNLNGSFGLNNWADPAYTVNATLDALDLDRYVSTATDSATGNAAKKNAPPAKFDFTWLKPLKLDGDIKIGLLKSSGTTARNVKIHLESATIKSAPSQ